MGLPFLDAISTVLCPTPVKNYSLLGRVLNLRLLLSHADVLNELVEANELDKRAGRGQAVDLNGSVGFSFSLTLIVIVLCLHLV